MSQPRMGDVAIRSRLKCHLLATDPKSILIDEFSLCRGEGKADLAYVGQFLTGFEIKSDADSLNRLPRQVDLYDQVFERVVLVVAKRHLERALQIVPAHWGVYLVEGGGQIPFHEIREAAPNPHRTPDAVLQLMWKDEVVQLLRSHGVAMRPRMLVAHLWKLMRSSLTLQQISEGAHSFLKTRYAPID